MHALLTILVLAIWYPAAADIQEATKTAPHAYQLRFENNWVRVIRVHYGPRERVAAHAHTKWPAAYVYLNDGGPIIFRHKDWDHPELTRPPTKAGSFRLSPTTAVNEIHEVENPTDIPSDFLRVEFKTRPTGRDSLRGRFYRGEYPACENFREVHFENQQVRVTRLICAPHESLTVAASTSEPALLIALSGSRVKFDETRRAGKETTLEPGQAIWVDSSQQVRLENIDGMSLEVLRFDLRTAPIQPEKRKSRK